MFHCANKLFFFNGERKEQVCVLDMLMPSNFTLQMESFVRRLMKGEDPEGTGRDGLKALRVLLAAYESFETKRLIRIY